MNNVEEELWASIPVSPSDQVSNQGRVKGVTGKILKQTRNKGGYMVVCIGYPQKSYLVHRLVADGFNANLEGKPFINHKNGHRDDNRLANLEPVTAKENNCKQVYPAKNNRTSSKKIVQLTLDGKYVREWESGAAASRAYGVGKNTITSACRKKGSSGGYKWLHLNDYEDQVLSGEEWKSVAYDGEKTLDVSSLGRVKLKSGVITYGGDSAGYMSIYPDGKGVRVHRLVALAFVPNPENKEIVNHKDGGTKNNAAFNLEWVTRKENADHAVAAGLHKVRAVRMISIDGTGTIFNSVAEASRQTRVLRGNIEAVCRGERNKSGGVYWEYYSPEAIADDDPIWAELGL